MASCVSGIGFTALLGARASLYPAVAHTKPAGGLVRGGRSLHRVRAASPDLGAVDELARDVAQLHVAGGRRPGQERERALLAHVVALHEDADGLTDDLAAAERGLQVL